MNFPIELNEPMSRGIDASAEVEISDAPDICNINQTAPEIWDAVQWFSGHDELGACSFSRGRSHLHFLR
jgi:hypothetical protein